MTNMRLFVPRQRTEVREKLGLKIHSPNEIQDGHMQPLLKWHEAQLRN